jgi:hypothetical protein
MSSWHRLTTHNLSCSCLEETPKLKRQPRSALTSVVVVLVCPLSRAAVATLVGLMTA